MYRILFLFPFIQVKVNSYNTLYVCSFFLLLIFFCIQCKPRWKKKKKETHGKLQNICKIRGVQQTTILRVFELVGYKTKCLHFLYNVNL